MTLNVLMTWHVFYLTTACGPAVLGCVVGYRQVGRPQHTDYSKTIMVACPAEETASSYNGALNVRTERAARSFTYIVSLASAVERQHERFMKEARTVCWGSERLIFEIVRSIFLAMCKLSSVSRDLCTEFAPVQDHRFAHIRVTSEYAFEATSANRDYGRSPQSTFEATFRLRSSLHHSNLQDSHLKELPLSCSAVRTYLSPPILPPML